MHIVFAGNFGFPSGSAAASRISKYALGLRAAGGTASVLAAVPSLTGLPPGQWASTESGINYTVALPADPRAASRRRWLWSPGYMQHLRYALYQHLQRILHAARVDAVVGYGQSAYVLHPMLALCHRLGVPCVFEVNEWQSAVRFRGRVLGPFYWDRQLFRLWTLPKADGAIAISTLWERYAQRRGLRVIRIPALGESAPLPRSSSEGPLLVTYLGSFNARDLPLTILDGFRRAVAAGVQARLVMVGDIEQSSLAGVIRRRIVQDPVLSRLVKLTGRVSEAEVQARLREAHALVLLRPDTWESRAAFPTRVPEYLLTGNPVVLSRVGDVALYLHHGESALLLCPADQTRGLAEAIGELSRSPERARVIGLAGQSVALREFACSRHGTRLLEFLRSLGGPRVRDAGGEPETR